MGKAWARPRGFRGDSELRPTLERNDRSLSTFISGYVPSYNEDGSTLVLRGDLQVPGSILMAAGQTVDGVDPSSHTHSGVGSNGSQVDHGSLLGTADDDHIQYLNEARHVLRHQGARVARATAYTLASSTSFTVIPWTAEDFDDDAWHSNVTNSSRITVTDAGWYLLSAGIQWSAAATGQMRFLVNGTAVARAASTQRWFTLSTAYKLTAGQYVEVDALQTSGTDRDIESSSSTFFTVVRLG
jgi:hypothetical protein